MYMVLDVHTEIYPIEEKSRYLVLLTETLSTDGILVDPRNAQVILFSLFWFLITVLVFGYHSDMFGVGNDLDTLYSYVSSTCLHFIPPLYLSWFIISTNNIIFFFSLSFQSH